MTNVQSRSYPIHPFLRERSGKQTQSHVYVAIPRDLIGAAPASFHVPASTRRRFRPRVRNEFPCSVSLTRPLADVTEIPAQFLGRAENSSGHERGVHGGGRGATSGGKRTPRSTINVGVHFAARNEFCRRIFALPASSPPVIEILTQFLGNIERVAAVNGSIMNKGTPGSPINTSEFRSVWRNELCRRIFW